MLSTRLAAMTKKLALETKIRDAALSLSKANASYKNVSKQTTEQLDTANRKVEQAQKDLWSVSERTNEIQRKLLEHRAGVLSYSVRSLEKKAAPDGDSSTSGYSSPSRSVQMSPTASSVTSMATTSSKGRFEHFFAGHSDAVTPTTPRLPPTMAEVAALEDKLKAATAALEAATVKQGEMTRELSLLRLEKEQIETSLGMDLQAAEETIAELEQSAGRADDVDARVQELEAERDLWLQDQAELEQRRREVDTLERRLEVLEEQSGEVADMENAFAQEREELRGALAARERTLEQSQRQLAEVQTQWDAERASWLAEKAALQDGAQSKVQLAECSDALRDLMHTHGILLASRDPSLSGLVQSVALHMEDMRAKAEAHARAEDEWAALRTKLELDIRAGLDKREALFGELEEARKVRDEAKAQVRDLELQLRVCNRTMLWCLFLTSLLFRNKPPHKLHWLTYKRHMAQSTLQPMPPRSSHCCNLSGLYCLLQRLGPPSSMHAAFAQVVVHPVPYWQVAVTHHCPTWMFGRSRHCTTREEQLLNLLAHLQWRTS